MRTKRIYIAPATCVLTVSTQQMVCNSPATGQSVTFSTTGSAWGGSADGTPDAFDPSARRGSAWDDEEE